MSLWANIQWTAYRYCSEIQSFVKSQWPFCAIVGQHPVNCPSASSELPIDIAVKSSHLLSPVAVLCHFASLWANIQWTARQHPVNCLDSAVKSSHLLSPSGRFLSLPLRTNIHYWVVGCILQPDDILLIFFICFSTAIAKYVHCLLIILYNYGHSRLFICKFILYCCSLR